MVLGALRLAVEKRLPALIDRLRQPCDRFSAAGENSAGETVLLTNGARSAIVRPPLHAGEAIAVKSPASIAAVGTNWKQRRSASR